MKTTTVGVAFDIYGEHFDPNYIAELLNILSDYITIKGIHSSKKKSASSRNKMVH
ncbi:hypothetical protein [Snodgrassella sp. CS2]|uniref:hypothetical protein n=1 Tax=Snodgrassella sp. CS2 TaxID=3418953 RepID=UPI003CFF468B